ncbi:unnamed protein product [Paramecium octaurelia]|uniref:Transmembrane protein n=1 Tax=Paramecium octaurelia TaxID=43137 RepID=A0A8S1WPP1_PAROT|nr:unnamed protein product [Paramecium octaurelia]
MKLKGNPKSICQFSAHIFKKSLDILIENYFGRKSLHQLDTLNQQSNVFVPCIEQLRFPTFIIGYSRQEFHMPSCFQKTRYSILFYILCSLFQSIQIVFYFIQCRKQKLLIIGKQIIFYSIIYKLIKQLSFIVVFELFYREIEYFFLNDFFLLVSSLHITQVFKISYETNFFIKMKIQIKDRDNKNNKVCNQMFKLLCDETDDYNECQSEFPNNNSFLAFQEEGQSSLWNQIFGIDSSVRLNSEATNIEIIQSSGTTKVIKKKKIQTALPGESKNLHKCYGRQLQLFIRNFCNKTNNSSLKEDQHIKQFLQIPGDKIGKYELNQFLNCQKGKMFSQEFFGQCLWKYNVVKESKTSVSSLFRHNIEPFWETNKKIKS